MKNLIIFVGIFLLTGNLIYSQAPQVYSVSYINNNTVRISWSLETSKIVSKFHVARFKQYISNNTPFYDTIASTSAKYYDYTIPDEDSGKVLFFAVTVTYTDGSSDISNQSKKPWIDAPSNVVLSSKFDSCNFQDSLIMNLFRGWNYGSVNKYSFRYHLENEPYKPLKFGTDVRDTLYTHETDSFYILKTSNFNLLPNKIYYFKATIGHTYPEEICVTNEIRFSTYTRKPPSYINADGTEVLSNTAIRLKFHIDTLSQLHTYHVVRSNDIKGNYATIDTLVTNSSYIEDSDYVNVDASKNQYFYKLISINNCGVDVTNSNVESNILLTIDRKDYNINLTWSAYETFTGDKVNYYIKRRRNDSLPGYLADGPITLKYSDNISNLKRNPVENFCYYIEAFEEGNPHNVLGYALSNTVCIEVRSDLEMPEYCNPKSKPYKPKDLAYIPDKYHFIVYDRWGTKVYESTDKNDPGWNGKYDNGKGNPATQGTYLYYIKVTKDNNSQEKKGYFVLVLP
jgi:hypothetical protein